VPWTSSFHRQRVYPAWHIAVSVPAYFLNFYIMKIIARLCTLPTLVLAACICAPAHAATLEISGSTTVQKRVFETSGAGLNSATGLEVKFLPVGSGKGLMALVDGKVSVSASSETLAETQESAKKAAAEMEKPFSPPSNLMFHELAKDVVVVIVNKDNPIASLSKAQLKDLNTGKIKNWKEVGGPDLAVKIVTSHAGSATRAVFQKQMMDGAEYVAGAAEIRTTKEEITAVGKDAGAIGALSESFVAANPAKVRIVKAPEMVRPLGLITIGQPKPEVQKLIDFFHSPAGKKLIQ
jgi:phosphate transport system substrate-binding protein